MGRFIACKLAKAGYFGGNPSNVMEADVRTVFDVLSFERFESDYISVYNELNKEGS